MAAESALNSAYANATSGGGQLDYNKLLQGLLGGAASMSPVGMAASAAGPVLDFIGNLLGGQSPLEKFQLEELKKRSAGRDKVSGLLQNRLAQGPSDPSQYLAQYEQSLAPRFNQIAESTNARLGLDSGVAQGDLNRSRQSDISNFYLQNVQSEKGRMDNYLAQLSSLYGG